MDIELICSLRGFKQNIWREFLAKAGLEADNNVDETALIWDGDALIATGSRKEIFSNASLWTLPGRVKDYWPRF